MRIWKAKELIEGVTDRLNSEELVDLFMRTTEHWYTQKENIFYGYDRNVVKNAILNFLEERKLPIGYELTAATIAQSPEEIDGSAQVIYALGKFEREWIGLDGQFVELKNVRRKIDEDWQIQNIE